MKEIEFQLPTVLCDIIIQFCYDIERLSILNNNAKLTYLNSRQLPVPNFWRNCLRYENRFASFNWTAFLSSDMNPHNMKTLINLEGVQNTIKILNWNHLKMSTSLMTTIMRTYQKNRLIRQLKRWDAHTTALIYQLQRYLVCCGKDNIFLRNQYNFNLANIRNPTPLSLYIKKPTIYY